MGGELLGLCRDSFRQGVGGMSGVPAMVWGMAVRPHPKPHPQAARHQFGPCGLLGSAPGISWVQIRGAHQRLQSSCKLHWMQCSPACQPACLLLCSFGLQSGSLPVSCMLEPPVQMSGGPMHVTCRKPHALSSLIPHQSR